MKKTILLALTITTLVSVSALAATPVLNDRQANHKARIAEGVATGELTKRETARLVKGQAQLQRMEYRAKKDGVVTKKERARLNNRAEIESVKIFKNKHDRQSRT